MLNRLCARANLIFLFFFVLVPNAFGQEPVIFSVILNTEVKGETIGEKTEDGDILLQTEYLRRIGITVTAKESVINNINHSSLRSLSPKVTYAFNEKNLSLDITADPSALKKASFNLWKEVPADMEYPLQNSAFLNYGLLFRTNRHIDEFIAPLETGVRMKEYLLYSNFNYTRSTEKDSLARLMTNMVRDNREDMTRFTLGDFNMSTGELGGGALLGGLNFAKNFSINPYFIRYPGIDLSGMITKPSDVEIWSDGSLLRRQRLSPGEFLFQNIPSLSGANDVYIVIRDDFGREERIPVPYYFSPALLKQGVHEYSYGIGAARNGFGTESFSYHTPAALAVHRYGFTQNLSGGIRAEADKDLFSAGITMNFIIGKLGYADVTGAFSLNHKKGHAYSMGYAYENTHTSYGFNLRLRGYSRWYSNLSLSPHADRAKNEVLCSAHYYAGKIGNFYTAFSYLKKYVNDNITKLSLRFSRRLTKNIESEITASTGREGKTRNELLLAIKYIFGRNTTGRVSYAKSSDEESALFSVQRIPPEERGAGFRVLAETKDSDDQGSERIDSELLYYGKHGVLSGRYTHDSSTDTFSLGLSGSISMVNSSVHFGQTIYDSFAVAKIGNLKGVDMYSRNIPVDLTDSKGEVFLNRISSYQDNMVSVDDRNLPLQYKVEKSEKRFAPPFRSGTFVEFRASKMQTISGTVLVVENGRRIPAEFWGITVRPEGRETESIIGRDGELYLENIPAGRHEARIFKAEKHCDFELIIPESEDLIINLGEISCTLK